MKSFAVFCLTFILAGVKYAAGLRLCTEAFFSECIVIPEPKHCIPLQRYSVNDQSINDHITSIMLEYTTCVILYDRNDCSGPDLIVRNDNANLEDVEFSSRVSSIGPCSILGRHVLMDRPEEIVDSEEQTTESAVNWEHPGKVQHDVAKSAPAPAADTDAIKELLRYIKSLNGHMNRLEKQLLTSTTIAPTTMVPLN